MGQIKVETDVGGITGLSVITPLVHGDERGYFLETYNKRELEEAGISQTFVQDNQSLSMKGVLRGLHFQKEHPQAKLVRVVAGAVFDVAVDIRKGSKTFGKWYGIELTEDNYKCFYIPEGFAHGFLVLSDKTVFSYKVSEHRYEDDEFGIQWNDADIGIVWPQLRIHDITPSFFDGTPLNISKRDKTWGSLSDLA